ncbi:hypothetical protein R3P38DRAFT_609827 [Favolaschia claudopus]|uniref:F-box domain-containing protein n=1 Tax=Favolaschia claudopus TaxID=2862362 RepID=A0AAW0CC42_9AGAR
MPDSVCTTPATSESPSEPARSPPALPRLQTTASTTPTATTTTTFSWTSTSPISPRVAQSPPLPQQSTGNTHVKSKTLRHRLSRVFSKVVTPTTNSQSNGLRSKFIRRIPYSLDSLRNNNVLVGNGGKSAPTVVHNNTHTLPTLPPELWILILEYSCDPFSSDPFSYDALPPTSPFPSTSTSSSAPLSLDLPTSFLTPTPFPTNSSPTTFGPRLASYLRTMRHKRTLSLVSRAFHAYAQPVLYADIWIHRAAQAKALALTLLCQAWCLPPSSSSGTSHDKQGNRNAVNVGEGLGRFIRRLHIETPALERCDMNDLRAVLAYAPGLEVFSDYRSVRRNLAHPGPGFTFTRDTTGELLSALARGGNLRRVSWTSYDDPMLVGLSRGLVGSIGERLEYLELNFVSTASVASSSVSALPHFKAAPTSSSSSSLSLNQRVCSGSASASAPALSLSLPSLRTLKVALDNATFAVLSTWDLPALRNLSVLSADFSYAGEGFTTFFSVHGKGLRQLELGHSSAHIEEFWLTAPPTPVAQHGVNGVNGSGRLNLNLAEWCPHLEEFVCSADAAWDWQHPDWIAPHLLLPAHPSVVLIGIRGVDARMYDDYARGSAGVDVNSNAEEDVFFGLRAQVESLLRREAFPRLKYVRDLSEGSDELRRGRVGLRGGRSSASFAPSPPPSAAAFAAMGGMGISQLQKKKLGKKAKREWERERRERGRVVGFWEGVLGRCREEGVWLEDWRGWNVTSGSLRRVRMGLGVGVAGEGEGEGV